MSCQFFHWDHNYACLKSGKDVDEDWYYKYCRNYDYTDCPIYKYGEASSESSCFLTSACVEAMGLPDDCKELSTLRAFRDTYLKNTPDGETYIAEYYRLAPRIVQCIRADANAMERFKEIYVELVLPCVALIEAGAFAEAFEKYRQYVLLLKGKYLCPCICAR